MRRRYSVAAVLASTLYLLSSCSSSRNPATIPSVIQQTSPALSCTITPERTNVIAGSAFNATVFASGGQAPYTVAGVSGSFVSNMTISRTLSSSSNVAQVQEPSITLSDTVGNSTSCKMSVVVFPSGTAVLPDFSCALIPSTPSPKVNETISLTPYVFDASRPAGLTYQVQIDTAGGNPTGYRNESFSRDEHPQLSTAYSNVLYDGAGNPQARIAQMSVFENGRNAICSSPITVRDNPSVNVTASASTVSIGEPITLTAVGRSFLSSAISYSFQTSDPGVAITQTGNTASVRVTDGRFHSPTITVTASANNEMAQATTQLNFRLLNFSCQVQGPTADSQPMTGQDITIGVTSSTGGNLEVFNIQTGAYGTIQSGSASPLRIQYSLGGLKTVSFFAKDSVSGTPCNSGSALSTTFTVREPLRCETALLPLQSNTGEIFNMSARAAISSGSSPSNIRIHSVTANRAGFELMSSSDNASWTGRFNEPGNFEVMVSLRDVGDANRVVQCPVAYHTAIFLNPSCSVAFIDPTIATSDEQKPSLIAARSHNPLRLRISAVNSTITDVNFGAPVLAGSTASDFRYVQPFPGPVTATVTVRNAQNGAVRQCSATLQVGPALSCTLNRTVNATTVINQWFRKGSTSETSTAQAPIPFNTSFYNSGSGVAPAVAEIQMQAVNELNYPGYQIDYRLNSFDGTGPQRIVAPTNLVSYRPGYRINGSYPFDARIFDPLDSEATGLGGACSLRDADQRGVANRLVVNTGQVIKFEKPDNASDITECVVYVRNRGNRPSKLSYYSAFTPSPMTSYLGDLHQIPVHSGGELITDLPAIAMPINRGQCGVAVKAFGDHLYPGQVGNTIIPDGGTPFELYVKVTFRRYYSNRYRSTVFYQLHPM